MSLIAVTSLRVRSIRFLLPFAWFAWRSSRQAQRAPGNLGVRLRKAEGMAFWTLTVWRNEEDMKAYRIAPPHLQAMPKLLGWCDEAALAHWNQDGRSLRIGKRRRGVWLNRDAPRK